MLVDSSSLLSVHRQQFAELIEEIFSEWRDNGNLLIYCKQGANRSVAFAILMICVLTGRPAEEVRMYSDCRHRAELWTHNSVQEM
jgi:predicted protein tyrosine phosphatase